LSIFCFSVFSQDEKDPSNLPCVSSSLAFQ